MRWRRSRVAHHTTRHSQHVHRSPRALPRREVVPAARGALAASATSTPAQAVCQSTRDAAPGRWCRPVQASSAGAELATSTMPVRWIMSAGSGRGLGRCCLAGSRQGPGGTPRFWPALTPPQCLHKQPDTRILGMEQRDLFLGRASGCMARARGFSFPQLPIPGPPLDHLSAGIPGPEMQPPHSAQPAWQHTS